MDLVYPNERRLFVVALIISILVWIALIIGTVGVLLLYIALFMLFMLFVHSGLITYIKGNGVKITAGQYPDLHEQLLECCKKLNVEKVPEFYLLRTDFFNAIATRFLRKHFVVLFSDVVDALEKRPGAINFYIGHELGHIHRNHLFWDRILAPALLLPILGYAYRRAEEYTCDRYGAACCESPADAAAAMAAIVAGDTRWKAMSIKNYLQQVNDTGGYGDYMKKCREFGKAIWAITGKGNDVDFVFEHPGEQTFPVSCFVVKRGGMVVFCAGTTGYNLTFDARYVWMRQKRVQGSHFASKYEADEANHLVEIVLVNRYTRKVDGFIFL